jgi:N-acetyl-anhydromuramyl-L-alanine amidase AmpD
MNIVPFYLDVNNTADLFGVSVAQRVRDQGKEHLWSERSDAQIDTIVIHYASAAQTDPPQKFDVYRIIKIFCDLGVSSHYIIDRSGTTLQLVPEEKKAWHCGGSIMPAPDNRQGVNDFSIGVELIATAESGFTKNQYRTLTELCVFVEKNSMQKMTCLGHEDIAGQRAFDLGLRKDIKTDPGNKFDWPIFRNSLSFLRKPLSQISG